MGEVIRFPHVSRRSMPDFFKSTDGAPAIILVLPVVRIERDLDARPGTGRRGRMDRIEPW